MKNLLFEKINDYFNTHKFEDEPKLDQIDDILQQKQCKQRQADEKLRQQYYDILKHEDNIQSIYNNNDQQLVLPQSILDPLLQAQNQKINSINDYNQKQYKQISLLTQFTQLLLEDNQNLRKRINKQLKDFKVVCQNFLTNQDQIVNQLEQENQLLQQENSLILQESEKFKENINIKQFYNNSIQQQLDQLLIENQNQKDQIRNKQIKEKEYSEKLILQQSLINDLNDKVTQYQKQLQKITICQNINENKITTINKLGNCNYQNIQEILEEIQEQKEKIQFQQKQIKKLEEDISQKVQIINTYQEQNDKLKSQHQQLDKQFFELKSSYENSIQNNKILKQQIQDLKNKKNLSQLPQNQKMQQLKNDNTQLLVNFEDLQQQYEVLQNKLLYLEDKVQNNDLQTEKQFYNQIEQLKMQININEDLCTEKDILIQQLQKELDEYQMERQYFNKNIHKINDFPDLQKQVNLLKLQLQEEKQKKEKQDYDKAIALCKSKQEFKKQVDLIMETNAQKINDLQDQNIEICQENLKLQQNDEQNIIKIKELKQKNAQNMKEILQIMKKENYKELRGKIKKYIQSQFNDDSFTDLQKILQDEQYFEDRNKEIQYITQNIQENDQLKNKLKEYESQIQKEQNEKNILLQNRKDKEIQTDQIIQSINHNYAKSNDFGERQTYTQQQWTNKNNTIRVNRFDQQQNLQDTIRYRPERQVIYPQTPKKVTFVQQTQITTKKQNHRQDCNSKNHKQLQCDRFNCYCDSDTMLQNPTNIQPINLSNLPFLYYDK